MSLVSIETRLSQDRHLFNTDAFDRHGHAPEQSQDERYASLLERRKRTFRFSRVGEEAGPNADFLDLASQVERG